MRRTHASAPTQDHNIMSAPSVEFWLDLASPYCYLSALRITPLAKAAGVTVRWRPFLLGPIFRAQGWQDSPYNAQPAKRAYLWRDMARQADKYQLPFSPPSEFPRHARHAVHCAPFADVGIRGRIGKRDFGRELVVLAHEDHRQLPNAG